MLPGGAFLVYAGCMPKTNVLPAEHVAEDVTDYSNLDTLQAVVQAMVEIAKDPKSKPTEKLRALNQIAELRGFKIDRSTKDIRRFSHDELHAAIRDLVLPTLAGFGVKPSKGALIGERADKTAS